MRHVVLVLAIASTAFVGCGGGAEKAASRLAVYPVSGTLKFKGRPIAGADITFVCAEKDKSAFGRTDDQGNFQLTTYSGNDGAVDGKHVVVVSKPDVGPVVKGLDPEDPAYDPIALSRMPPPRPKTSEFPARYTDVKKSDLIAVVTPDANNTALVLELKD